MLDIHQTQPYANYLQKTGWTIEKNKGNYYFIKKIPVVGYIIKVQRPEFIDFQTIKILGEKYKTFQTIIEPKNEFEIKTLYRTGFKLSKSPFLPTKTLKVDLTKNLADILNNLKKDAKGFIRKNETLTILNSNNNIKDFRKHWKKTVGLKRYVPPLINLKFLQKSFKKNCLFAISKTKNAGAIFLIADNTLYYWQAFTNLKGRKNKEQYRIVWEGIRWGIAKGARIFDMEGIYDERFPNKSWRGFSHFKKSFGGETFYYPGCFTKYRL